MSVVGFDVGNYKSSVGIARAGGIEIVANEYSDRITPTYIAFTNNERFQGHSAKQQEITNSQNTISGFKRLLARKMNDPQVQQERSYHPLRITTPSENGDDKIHFEADYLNETKTYTTEQVMGTFLNKLKTIAEMNLNTKVHDCVVSVPCYMTDAERRAMLDAAQIAGLNCLKLMNETTAVALSYGLYHTNLPEPTEKPQTVVFVDMGYTHLQCSAVHFNKGKLRMLATTFDNNLGGRDFDKVLMDYFQKDFKARYNVDAYTNTRARLRLRAECEKLKKLMSSNSSPIPLNIECFMNDKDVQGKMKRDEFEALAESLLARVKQTMQDLLTEAKITAADIDVVEIVGGSSRIPAVKHLIQQTYNKEPSTTLNADEACARGCAIMCAILSPTFKVKEFKIEDSQLFPITLSWKAAETEDNEIEVFPRFEKIPLSKLLTIYKKEPFEIEARYRFPNNIPFNEPRIGKFFIGNVVPNAQGENSEVKLKARITKSGIFEISSPQLIETTEVQEASGDQQAQVHPASASSNKSATAEENSEQVVLTHQQSEEAQPEDANMNEENSNAGGEHQQQQPAQAAQPVKVKRKTKSVDLPLTARVPQLTKDEINFFVEQELAMIQQDRKEKERSEAKNSVEEYIYEIRDKLSNEYEKFTVEENKSSFLKILDDTESWLYSEDAENQEKSVYVDRLNKLKSFGEPLRKRYKESQDRPQALEEFGKSLQLVKKALNSYYGGEEKYAHLDKNDVDRAGKIVEEKQRWFEEKSNLIMKMKPTEDPVVLVSQIKDEKDTLDRQCWAILNKPKPKVEPPKPKEEPKAQPQANGQSHQNGSETNGQEAKKTEAGMEVD